MNAVTVPTPAGSLDVRRVEATDGCVSCGATGVAALELTTRNAGRAPMRMDWCGGCLAAALGIRLAAQHQARTGEPVVLPVRDA